MKVVCLLGMQEVLTYRLHVERLMDAAKFPGPLLYDWRYVIEKAMRGEWQIWFMFEEGDDPTLMMITWVQQFPGGKQCFIELLCGEGLMNFLQYGGVFDNWLKLEGIDLVRGSTRPSIAKFLSRHGWQTGSTAIFKRTERMQ